MTDDNSTFHGLTDQERLELADQMGKMILYFVEVAREARHERDEAKRLAASAIAEMEEYRQVVYRYRRNGSTRDTAVAVERES